jgi:hypothetical protein
MITKRLIGGGALALMLLLTSCGKKSPSYTKYITNDANYVVGIDVRSILEKLEKDSMSVENMMTAIKDEANLDKYKKAVDMYNQFKDAGIDWSSRVYVAASFSGNFMGGGGATFGSETVAGLKDAKKFEDFLKKQPETKDIKKGDGFSYTGGGGNVIGWNDDAVIMVSAQSTPSYTSYMPDSSGNMTLPPSETNATESVSLLSRYFKLNKDSSIADAEGFGDLQSKMADITVYSQTGDMSKLFPVFALPKFKDLLKGYSTSTVNFEDGKIAVEGTSHLSKQLSDLLKKYAGPEVDLDLIENYPSANVDAVVAFSFKPELVTGLLQEFGAMGFVEQGLQGTGLTTADINKFFKGDFAVVVSDFSMAKETAVMGKDAMTTYSSTQPTAKVIFTAKLGDKAVVDKVLKLAQDRGFIIRNGNSIMPNPQMGGGAFPYAISIANDKLVFASDSAVFNAYLANTQKIGLSAEVKNSLKGKAMSAYVDMEKIFAGINPSTFDSSDVMEKAVFEKAKATFKNGWYTMDNISGSTITAKGEVNFVDTKKNSLSQIVSFGLYAYQQQQAQSQKEMETMPMMVDSTAPAVPVPADPTK